MTTKENGKLVVNRRRFLQLGGMGLAGAVIAACGGGAGSTTTAAAGTATTSAPGTTAAAGGGITANLSTISIGDFNPNYAAQRGYHMADALGYFDEVGIEDIEYVLSEEYVPGLIGGSLHLAHADTNVIIGSAHESGEPLKIISLYRVNEWQIMGVAAGIEEPEDLIGKNITGGQLEGRNTVVQRQILERMGIDPSQVNFVPTSGGSDARLQALITNTVQGASVFPRHRFALEEAGGKFIYEELFPAPQECFAAMGPWLEENHATAVAFIVAELRGRQFVMDPANKDQAFDMMVERGFEIPDEFRELYQVEIDQFSPDGGFDVEAMDTFIEELKQTGDVPEGAEWRDYVDFTYLWEAQDILGIPRNPDPDAL